jgi:hypothetical protein
MSKEALGRIGIVRFDERTPDEAGFADVFAREISPRIQDWNENRLLYATLREKRTEKIRLPLMILAASTGACTLFGAVGLGIPFGFFLLSLGTVTIVLSLVWAHSPRYKGAEPSATDALNEVLGRFGLELVESDDDVPMTSKIRPAGDEVASTFHFGGTYRDLDINARWLICHRTETDESGQERRTQTFKGWFVRVRPPFDFDGTTVVVGKRGVVKDRGTLEKMDGVMLEDAAFAERFGVYATDQVEARVILTPDVMHHLAEHAAALGKTSGDLMLAFEGETADVALPQAATTLLSWHPQDMAEAVNDTHHWFAEIRRILSFVDDIDALAEGEGFRAERSRNLRKETE